MSRRILFFNQPVTFGGTDTFFINLLKSWPDKKDEFTVWLNQKHTGQDLYKKFGINFDKVAVPAVVTLGRFIKGYNSRSVINKACRCWVYLFSPVIFLVNIIVMYKKFKKHKFDVVFVSNGGYPGGMICQAMVIAAKFLKIKKIFLIIHNFALKPRFPFKFWEYHFMDRLVSSACSEIISVSNSCARQIEITRNFKRRVRVIYNGIIPERKDRRSLYEKLEVLQLDGRSKLIGDIGDYEERKGHKFLIQAFLNVKEAHPDAKLVIIGNVTSPYAEELDRLVNESVYRSDIYLAGYLPNAWEYIECFDILVLPSVSFESFGLTLLEAMLYKKPVIGTSTGGIPEVIGDAGYIVESGNAGQIAEKIIYLLRYPEIAKELGNRGFSRLINNFTAEKMAREYYKLTV